MMVSMSVQFEDLRAALSNGGVVEIDVGMNPGVGNDYRSAQQASRGHAEAISRGERVAHLYTKECDAQCAAQSMPRAAALTIGATLEQVRELIAAGAKWIGPEAFKP